MPGAEVALRALHIGSKVGIGTTQLAHPDQASRITRQTVATQWAGFQSRQMVAEVRLTEATQIVVLADNQSNGNG